MAQLRPTLIHCHAKDLTEAVALVTLTQSWPLNFLCHPGSLSCQLGSVHDVLYFLQGHIERLFVKFGEVSVIEDKDAAELAFLSSWHLRSEVSEHKLSRIESQVNRSWGEDDRGGVNAILDL